MAFGLSLLIFFPDFFHNQLMKVSHTDDKKARSVQQVIFLEP